MLEDLRYALRQLRRSPGFTVVAVLTLALGIGANTTIFSLLRGILLRPLPYSEPDRSVMLWSHWKGWDKTWVSPSEVEDYAGQTQIFASVSAFDDGSFTLAGEGEPERVRGGLFSASFFGAAGVQPLLGRTFTADEDRPNGPRLVLLSEGLWRRRYGGDPAIIGRSIRINALPFTVIGVMPAAFRLPIDFSLAEPTQLWTPLQLPPADAGDRGNHGLYAVGRLKDGVSGEQGQRLMDEFMVRMKQQWAPQYSPEFGVTLVTLREEVLGRIRPALLLLLGAVGLVLLIACGNIANLLLARGEARQKELAIRAALGAGRAQLIRQLLTESVLLAVAGGAAGVFVALWGVAALPAINPASLPRVESVSIDPSVLAATFLLSLVTGIVFGIYPAWEMVRPNVQSDLKDNGRGLTTSRAGRRFRSALITAEVALAVVLVTGAGLLVRSYLRLAQVDPGFNPDKVLTMRLSPPEAAYPTRSSLNAAYDRIFARLRGLPGVEQAGAVSGLPLATTRGDWGITVEGYTPPNPQDGVQADWQVVRGDYFGAMQIPVMAGRAYTDEDRLGSAHVIVINQAMARKYWKDGHAVGQRVKLRTDADTNWRTVIGVVGDVRHRGLNQPVRPEMYLPQTQFFETAPDSEVISRSMSLTLKSRGHATELVAAVRAEVQSVDPSLAISEVRTMDDIVSRSISAPRFTAVLLGIFGGLALVLAAVGIYGLVAFVVAQRTGEMGIRLALGAAAGDILRLVISQGMQPVVLGLAAGLVAALVAARLLTAMLVGVTSTDLATYAGVTAFLGAVGLLACWLPARRATQVDPVVALRQE
ncbi:MAG TPA: ABC transporter permease [Gemmatimonadales bacterium]|nr:ABC transporter permease [Gemmatimonadales bacterium]